MRHDGQPVKVAYINHTSEVGGAELSLLLLLENIDKNLVEPLLVCPNGELSERAKKLGIRVSNADVSPFGYADGPIKAFNYTISLLRSAKSAGKALRELEPDIIHANSIRAALLASLAGLDSKTKLISHTRDCPPVGFQGRLVMRIIRKRASVFIAISNFISSLLKSMAKEIDIRVIYNGVDTHKYNPSLTDGMNFKNKIGLNGHKPIISVIGQITPWKGQSGVIRAFGKISNDLPEARLLIVGKAKFSGPSARYDTAKYEQQLRSEANIIGLNGRLIFTGEQSDIPSVISASDIVVLNSQEEPFGRVLIEAMAMEKPVVATLSGAIPEVVVHKQSGLLVPVNDDCALAGAIKTLADDAELRAKMGKAGRKRVLQMFSAEKYTQNVVNVYKELVQNK